MTHLLQTEGRDPLLTSSQSPFIVPRTEDLVVKESGFSSFHHFDLSPFTKKGKAHAGPSVCRLQAPHVLQGVGKGGLTTPHWDVAVIDQPRGPGWDWSWCRVGSSNVFIPCQFCPDVTWAGFSKSPPLTWPRQRPAHHETLCLLNSPEATAALVELLSCMSGGVTGHADPTWPLNCRPGPRTLPVLGGVGTCAPALPGAGAQRWTGRPSPGPQLCTFLVLGESMPGWPDSGKWAQLA